MLNLENIDLIAISSDKPRETIKSLKYTMLNIKFDKVKFLTHVDKNDYTDLDIDNIEFIKIDEITSHRQYNDFCLQLSKYSENEYILIVQNDSFVTNKELWCSEFLEYDYIGAPWTEKSASEWGIPNRVGNGGFSLRSKKFLEYSSKFTTCSGINEDGFLTNFTLNYATQFGIKYAPVDLAYKFSVEIPNPDDTYDPSKHFGFHGNYLYEIAESYLQKKNKLSNVEEDFDDNHLDLINEGC